MKKVLLSLLAVAALVLSCQNYDDEFAALNSKVASLESQISSLAGLQTALTQVQSSVSALQAAVSAIPNLSSEVAAIIDDLDALATAVAGASTSADLDALKAELDSTLADLLALIEENGSDIASVVAANADLKSQLEALGVDVDAVLAQNSTYTGNLTITNAAELAFAKSLGDKVKIINGNVAITIGYTNELTAADVKPVSSIIEQVVGNVTLSMDHEAIDLSALVNVSGDYLVEGWDPTDDNLANVGDMYLEYRFPYTFTNLVTAKKIILSDLGKSDGTTKSTTAVTEPIGAQPGVTSVNFLALKSATSISTGSADVHSSGASTHSSGGSINLTAGGSAGVLSLLNAETVKIGDVAVTSLKVNKATAVELHFDGTAAGIVVEDTNAGTTADPEVLSSVIVKAKKSSVAISIDMLKTGTFDASSLTDAQSTLESDALVNTLPALVYADGLTLSEATSISLPKLAVVGDVASTGVITPQNLTADKVTGTVSLPALTDAAVVSLDKADSFVAALASVSSIDISDTADEATIEVKTFGNSVTAQSSPIMSSTDAALVTTLKIHGQEVNLGANGLDAFTGITSAVLKGDVSTNVWDINAVHDELETLEIGGKNTTVTINTSAAGTITGTTLSFASTALKSITTSGTIHSLTIGDNGDLTSLTMGHTNETSASTAPVLSLTNNPSLSSITTSVASVSSMTITGNHNLTSMNFASINSLPVNFSASQSYAITITGNYSKGGSWESDYAAGNDTTASNSDERVAYTKGMTGSYTEETATVARSYTQAGVATLKPFIALLAAKYDPETGTAIKPSIDVHIDFQTDISTDGALAAAQRQGTFDFDFNNATPAGQVVITGTDTSNKFGATTETIAEDDSSPSKDEVSALLFAEFAKF